MAFSLRINGLTSSLKGAASKSSSQRSGVIAGQISEHFAQLHRDLETEIHLSAPVTEMSQAGIVLGNGTRIEAELVLLAAGVVPNTALAEQAGLAAPQDDAVTGLDGSIWRFAGDRLTAVETINNAKTHMQACKRLAGPPVSRAALLAADFAIATV